MQFDRSFLLPALRNKFAAQLNLTPLIGRIQMPSLLNVDRLGLGKEVIRFTSDATKGVMMTRRTMIRQLAAASPLVAGVSVGAAPVVKTRMGIGMHSYGGHWAVARNHEAGAVFRDALEFLEYGNKVGAGGVQVTLGGGNPEMARRIRKRSEELGLYFEGQLSLPRDESDVARFESEIQMAAEAGATVVRTAMLSGRRYETFDTAEKFRAFARRSWDSLMLAEPVVRRQRMRLAVENHKDWRVPEFVGMLEKLDSEFVGVCIDTGNSIALLEDPMAVVDAYLPWVMSTHIKDMAVQETEHGFLLSEVPLGRGYLDLAAMMAKIRTKSPGVQFNLEMITRDPLAIPCLTPGYWPTMPEVRGAELAGALRMVRRHQWRRPLPRVSALPMEEKLRAEDENVRQSLAFAAAELKI